MFRYKDFRRAVNISQKELANLLGCGQPNVSAMERSSRDLEKNHELILREKYGNEIINRFSDSEDPSDNTGESPKEDSIISELISTIKGQLDIIRSQQETISALSDTLRRLTGNIHGERL